MSKKIRILALATLVVSLTGISLLAQSQRKEKQEEPSDKQAKSDRPKESRRSGRKRVSEEKEQQVLKFLKSKKPGLHKQLVRIKEQSPRRYYWLIQEQSRWLQRYETMPAHVRQAMLTQYDQRLRILQLRRAAAQARRQKDQQELDKIEEQLNLSVAEHFDAAQTIRKHTLQVLRKRIESIEEEIKSRDRRRKQLIEDEINSIVRPKSSRRRSARQPAPEEEESDQG
jgi:hypothetical protein